jgi:hypothetical protein
LLKLIWIVKDEEGFQHAMEDLLAKDMNMD